jgi:putative endonuclease
MKYYTYILQSLKNGDLYIGSTADIYSRLQRHNNVGIKSTKPYRPWKLLEYEQYNSRGEAVRRERFLKTHQQKEMLKRKCGVVAER